MAKKRKSTKGARVNNLKYDLFAMLSEDNTGKGYSKKTRMTALKQVMKEIKGWK